MSRPVTNNFLPHNLEAERALIGSLIARNETYFEVSWMITPGDFFEPYHGELLKLIADLVTIGREVNAMSLLHDMAQDRDIGGVSASRYLHDLVERATPSVAKQLAVAVRDLSVKRQLIEIGNRLATEAANAPASLPWTDVLGHVENDLGSIFRSTGELGMRSLHSLGDDVLHHAAEAYRLDKTIGLDVGLSCVQDLTGPLMPGRLYVLAGSSGSGKSALAFQIAEYIAAQKDQATGGYPHPVLVVEIEMEGDELAERSLAARTGISTDRIERGAINADEFGTLREANEKLRGIPLFIDAAIKPTMATIEARATRMKKLTGLSVLVIDHLRYVEPPTGMKMASEWSAVQPNLQHAKRISKTLGIPVIMIAQLKGEFSNGPVRDPGPGDIWGGSAVEQEADVLMFVHREDYMLQRNEPPKPVGDDSRAAKIRADWSVRLLAAEGKAKIILGKRRGGKGFGSRVANFDGARTRFSDQPRTAKGVAVAAAPLFDAGNPGPEDEMIDPSRWMPEP